MGKFKISDTTEVIIKNTKTGDITYQATLPNKDMSVEDISNTKTPEVRMNDEHYEVVLPHIGKSVIIEKENWNGEVK